MAAVTYQESQLVWSKVKNALANANPATKAAFKGLQDFLANQFGVKTLKLYQFGDLSTGVDPDFDGPYQVYGVWGIKQHASDTDAWLKLRDNSTDILSLPFLVVDEESFAIFPKGLDIANAAGFKLESHTDSTGSTDSTATHGPVGFVLFGETK